MSSERPCTVPDSILPKNLRGSPQKFDCFEKICNDNCTNVSLRHVKPRQEKCMRPELAEMLRCQACQAERLKRMTAQQRGQNFCKLQKQGRNKPEVPFFWKPELWGIQFIDHGYTAADCFPKDVIEDPCQQALNWKKKTKQWIKSLDEHYNAKVISTCEAPIENYIRLNLANLCETCLPPEQEYKPEKCTTPENAQDPPCVLPNRNCGCMKY